MKIIHYPPEHLTACGNIWVLFWEHVITFSTLLLKMPVPTHCVPALLEVSPWVVQFHLHRGYQSWCSYAANSFHHFLHHLNQQQKICSTCCQPKLVQNHYEKFWCICCPHLCFSRRVLQCVHSELGKAWGLHGDRSNTIFCSIISYLKTLRDEINLFSL